MNHRPLTYRNRLGKKKSPLTVTKEESQVRKERKLKARRFKRLPEATKTAKIAHTTKNSFGPHAGGSEQDTMVQKKQ